MGKAVKQKKPLKAKKRKSPEYDLQCACTDFARRHYPSFVCFSIPIEACYSRKEHYAKSGMTPGTPDYCIAGNGLVVFVEFKSQSGRLSDGQKEFHLRLAEQDVPVFTVRSLDHFRAILKNIKDAA